MDEGVVLGKTPEDEDVVLSYERRRQHTYVIGVNGTGKTTLLRQLAYEDMRQEPKHGLCVIDPHGDLIEDIIALVPRDRIDDVILFNPSDEDAPFSLNLFAPVEPKEIPRVASEIVSIFQKIFGRGWTPEIEGVIQNVTLTLLCRPAGYEIEEGEPWVAAMDEIPALLAMERVPEEDREKPPWKRKVETYRSQFYRLLQEQDQIPVWEFWNYNFDTLTPRPRSELTLAVLNQVRRFLANPTVRNIVAQTESKLDLSQVMNEGRILLVNLSKGKLGEANSAFLGSVVVAKLVVAVFARAAIPPSERKPFHIIVDEFQNFAISSFPGLLSEGRKYNVDLVIAHQYREQLRDWVQGATVNAGNMICFRVGGDDALELAHEFDATPPSPDHEYRAKYRSYGGLDMPFYKHESQILEDSERALQLLAQVRDGETLDGEHAAVVSAWLYKWKSYAKSGSPIETRVKQMRDRRLTVSESDWTTLNAATEKLRSVRIGQKGYLQERAVYPSTPGTYHRSYPSDGGVSTSESSETGPVYDRVPGRSRQYSDVYQQIATDLTHLPNFEAKCRLAGSADPIIEQSLRTMEWPEGHEDSAKREELYDRNLKAAKDNTHRDFTRPRSEVAGDFKRRYELMLRSIGMSWTQDEPLPKPQVLYEDDD